jgi:ubiquinone/menaquinone biosynthesis C-methylase UbiE
MDEIARVLKPGGRYIITDMKRDMSPFMKWALWLIAKPREIRRGLISSINAAYTLSEIKHLVTKTRLQSSTITQNIMGIEIVGQKLPVS